MPTKPYETIRAPLKGSPLRISFRDLVNVDELQNLLEVNYAATGMPSGIIDTETGEVYAGAGWQRICTNFHRVHPETNKLCIKNDTAILNKIKDGKPYGYKCDNGLWDIGVPICCFDRHIATYFLGQFFYEDESIDSNMFLQQADTYGFNKAEYIEALYNVPRFTREKVNEILKYNVALSSFLSNLISRNMERFLEIEQRKKTEDKLRTLRNYLSNIIDSMPSVLIGVDPNGIITQWNSSAEQLTGLPHARAVGKPLNVIVPHLAPQIRAIEKAIATREKQVELKRRRQTDTGTRYEDITVYPLVTNGIEGAVIRVDDVTEQVSLEQMMVQSEKMLSIGGLAAGMAHEINNPLAAIIGFSVNMTNRIFGDLKANQTTAAECGVSLESVREYLRKRKIPHMLDGISKSGKRAAAIVRNMLSFSRKSNQLVNPESLTELMDNTLELIASDYDLKRNYDFRKIKIIRKYENVPHVLCERSEIQQVFLNILKNSAEAMFETRVADKEPTITVHITQEDDMAVIEIEDNGPGMDEETCKRAWEPFFTTKAVGKGTGLGLSVSYFIIVDQHNGLMDITSTPGKGACFHISLPITEDCLATCLHSSCC